MSARATPSLALVDIRKRFGDTTALDAVALTVRPGTVHALLGENGAGKTTLMRIVYGLVAHDAGTMTLGRDPFTPRSPADALAAGIGMVQQHFALVPAMTVAENVALGGRGRFSRDAARMRVRAVSEATGLALDPDARVETLPVAGQQRVEIAKALAREARLLILDEPTAVLAPSEAQDLLGWVRRFADTGGSAVLITHKLGDALAVADDVTVLRRGRVTLSAPRSAVDQAGLVSAMIGPGAAPRAAGPTDAANTPGAATPPGAGTTPGAVRLSLADASWTDDRGVTRLREATCEVRAGEIVGVAAVEGSGQAALLRLLAGRLTPTHGTATIGGEVGFVPEDRLRDAALADRPQVETVALRGAGARRWGMPWGALAKATRALATAFDVRGGDPDRPFSALSGGNQQKLVFARELEPAPAALVVENPTRGLDLTATAEVLAQLRRARDAGLAVVMHSVDLEEVLQVADRVLVVHDGAVREVPATRDAVGRAMVGAS